ncbi:MAG: peptidylprolyl isomerase [Kiritimatiellae bacterium]|nr:peptidylprolyl isomerase [Kiritimatiellia bacterium]
MLALLRICATLSAGLLAGVTVAPAQKSERVLLDGYAAFVNDRPILISDVLRYAQSADRQAVKTLSGPELEEALQRNYQAGLRALIERELILAEAERRKLDLPDAVVDAHINQLVRERFEGGRAALLAALAAEGLTYEEYRRQIRDDLRVMLLRRQEVNDRVTVPPAQLYSAYLARLASYQQPEQVRIRLLVLRKGATPEEAAARRRLAETLVERVRRGESFADLAREFSEGPAAAQGGDLGWRQPAELRPEIAATVRTLRPGEVSPVIELPEEFHLVALEARREARVRPFTEVAPELERELLKQQTEQRLDEWLSELRVRHYVRVLQETRP